MHIAAEKNHSKVLLALLSYKGNREAKEVRRFRKQTGKDELMFTGCEEQEKKKSEQ